MLTLSSIASIANHPHSPLARLPFQTPDSPKQKSANVLHGVAR